MTPHDGNRILPARPSAHVLRWFRWYVARMFGKSFASVRVSGDSGPALDAIADGSRPLIVAMNHSSWWDPLLGLLVSGEFCPDRTGLAPMDREMLERFGILRRIGVFGLDPDDPASLEAMRTYVGGFLREHPSGSLWLTPQGEFTDPRQTIRLRPGAATIAAGTPGVRVVSLAAEYTFWLDKKPEVFLHASEVPAPEAGTVATWHRALTHRMRDDNQRLSELVIARDASAFRPLLGGDPSGTSPIYNLWLRIRGKRADLASDRTARPKPSGTDGRTA